ncbi:MAG: fatty acid desaturase [Hyphomicrobiales bacterium]|nr:fatty acid desaturase [Hyphomicrobiales bacterium]
MRSQVSETDSLQEARPGRGVEWPTVALAATVYGGWAATTVFANRLPWPIVAVLGAWFVAWQGSLQHEALHGHPFRSRTLNEALAFWPLALWLPYERYRRSHLRHHRDERLTDPLDDPESYYWSPEQWERLGPLGRRLVRAQSTLLGRLSIGPFWMVGRFWRHEAPALLRGEAEAWRVWGLHLAGVAAVLAWADVACDLSPWRYVLLFAWPGTALSLVRSFAEHRAESQVERRTAIVERASPLSLLFLNNNLHVAHHLRPAMPWYELPRFYAQNREAMIESNGGLVYEGYGDVFRRYLLRPHDQTLHPRPPAPPSSGRLVSAPEG